MKRNNKGFTLVELMVVAIIVAILAAVSIPLMTANKRRAIATEAEAGWGTVRTAVRVYYAEHNSYPTGAVSAAVLTGIGANDLDGTYFMTTDYEYDGDGVVYTITATGSAGSGAPKANDADGISIELDQDGIWTRDGL